jgi:hypothetical protein
MNKPPECFHKICSEKAVRLFETKPFVFGDYIVSTDTSIIFVAKKSDFDIDDKDTYENLSINVGTVIDKINRLDFKPWKKCEIPEESIILDRECPECDGSGYVEFSNEFSSYECECETCDGKGETDIMMNYMVKRDHKKMSEDLIEIDGFKYLPSYVRLINDQAIEYSIDNGFLAFRSENFFGAMMNFCE